MPSLYPFVNARDRSPDALPVIADAIVFAAGVLRGSGNRTMMA